MTYIVQRQDRFYVVAYDGLDPLTGRERRRWHSFGHDRADAEDAVKRFDRQRAGSPVPKSGPITLGEFLHDVWLAQKRRQVRATTAYRYSWFVDRYVRPAISDVPLRRLRADHLDTFYESLATTGGRDGKGPRQVPLNPCCRRSAPACGGSSFRLVGVRGSREAWGLMTNVMTGGASGVGAVEEMARLADWAARS